METSDHYKNRATPKSQMSRIIIIIQNKMKIFKKNNVLITLLFIVAFLGSTFYFSSCKKDPCKGVTCQNGGTSVSSGNNCTCNCPTGYEGQFCETKIPFQGPQNASFEIAGGTSGAANWYGYPLNLRKTGTGFLPSQGVYFAQTVSTGTSTFYQDGVDLTHSSTMTFDYTFTYSVVGSSNVVCTFQVLFTSSGTTTLFQQTIDSISTRPIQILNKTITLPTTAAPGRLTFNAITSPSFGYPVQTVLEIDNIRVN